LAGIRGKTCSLVTEQVLPRMPANQMRVLQVLPRMPANQNSVTCARVAGTEVCGCHRGRKLIFITVEIDF